MFPAAKIKNYILKNIKNNDTSEKTHETLKFLTKQKIICSWNE